MSEGRTAEEREPMAWSRWYGLARDEMAFRFGMRRAPVDRYKEQWAMGATPHEGAKRIYENFMARGRRH